MRIRQSRRDFLAGVSAAGAAGLVGARPTLADEAPLETTTIRLSYTTGICFAPIDVAEELLRAEGLHRRPICERRPEASARRR